MRKIIFNSLIYIGLLLIAVTVIYPMIWIAITSLKTNQDFYTNIFGLPKQYMFENYAKAWTMSKINRGFFNSLIVVPSALFFLVLMASTSAYILSRFKFKGSNLIRALYISVLTIPASLGLVPQFMTVKELGLYDTRTILIILYALGSLPFSQFLLYGFLKTVPVALEESAYIDGASYSRTFFSIVFPVIQPAIITILITSFISFFNEFFTAYIYITDPNKYTLPVGLANLVVTAKYRTDWGMLMASNMFLVIPTFLFFAIFSSKIQQGMTVGSLKG